MLEKGTYRATRYYHDKGWNGKPYVICERPALPASVSQLVDELHRYAIKVGAFRRYPGHEFEYMVELKVPQVSTEPRLYTRQGLEWKIRQLLLQQCRGRKAVLGIGSQHGIRLKVVGVVNPASNSVSCIEGKVLRPDGSIFSDANHNRRGMVCIKIRKIERVELFLH